MTDKLMRLAPTSAMVLLFAGPTVYESELARAYWRALDLSDGQDLVDGFLEIWPHYAHSMHCRKLGVRRALNELAAAQKDKPWQLLLAGSGMEPLGLDLVQCHPNLQLFELDREGMADKETSLTKFTATRNASALLQRMHFVDADLMEPQACQQKLDALGWKKGGFSAVLYEGIVYYLSQDALRAANGAFAPDALVVEYIRPAHELHPDVQHIAVAAMKKLETKYNLPPMSRFNTAQLGELFGYQLQSTVCMADVEKTLADAPGIFPTADHGWVEISHFTR